jgi:hypothetical protein
MEDSEEKEIERSLSTLKTNACEAEDQVLQALNRLKLVEFKLKQELDDLSETQLKSKASLRHWLESRGLSKDCSFQQFFERFLEEHKQEYRLDLTDRSVILNKEACKLFGLGGKDAKLTMIEILERLPQIYH